MSDPESAIALPEPCLVVLVGPAGSGKSTFAARNFDSDAVLSSDALREALTGDAGDQSLNGVVFATLHEAVERRLAARRTTVVDATNVERHARRALVSLGARSGCPVVAIVLELPLEVVLDRNARRPGRGVPVDVVVRHHRRLARELDDRAFDGEGFAAVHHLIGAAAIDDAVVRRISGS
jgi:protein phosphatase